MECFIQKLKSSVDNNDLQRLNYLVIKVSYEDSPNVNEHTLDIYYKVGYTGNKTLQIVGDGFFTDSSLVTNLGKTAEAVTANVSSSQRNIRFSNGNYIILIPIDGLNCFNTPALGLTSVEGFWDNLDYERLAIHNEEIGKLAFRTEDDLIELPDDVIKNIKSFKIVKKYNEKTDAYDAKALIEKIVETGITTSFSFYASSKDFYGTFNGHRNIHITTAGTSFSVYNEADTTVLYTAVKSGGKWTYTLVE